MKKNLYILMFTFKILFFAILISGCSGNSASSSDGGAVTGVSTPSKVSVVNTN